MGRQAFPASNAAASADNAGGYVADVYRRHWGSLCRYLRQRHGSGAVDPEEVAQTAFLRFASLQRPDAIASPRAWLARCATNIALSQYRHDRVRVDAHADLGRAAREEHMSEFSPERVLLGRECLALVERAVMAMPQMRRRAFLLVRAEGLRCADAAKVVGITERAVYQHVCRAVKDIEAALARDAEETGPDCAAVAAVRGHLRAGAVPASA